MHFYFCWVLIVVRQDNQNSVDGIVHTEYSRILEIHLCILIHFNKPMPPLYGLLFPVEQWICYMHHPTNRIAHITAFVIPVVEHWLKLEIVQWVNHEESI